MPTDATPGVHVEEVPARNKPIEGVSTSTAAFVGLAPAGPFHHAIQISSWSQFERTFTDPENPDDGPFLKGAYLAHAVNGFFANGGALCWVVRVADRNPDKPTLNLGVLASDGTRHEGTDSLRAIDDISMICCPDVMPIAADDHQQIKAMHGEMIKHCEGMGDRMAILDTPPGLIPIEAETWRMTVAGYDSKQAALYYPWLEVLDPLTNLPMLVPPCGHVAGIWARTASTRGVHSAPANEAVLGVTGLAMQVTSPEQERLTRNGLNCVRSFPGRGIRVWGARTLSSDPEWRYVNVRRLFNFISGSIMQGTQSAAFEPNDEQLWIQLRIAVSNFLTIAWRNGALFGAKPEDAFYVKCDSETNPPEMIAAGQVTIEIGICPVTPAEFVVFRVSQYSITGADAQNPEKDESEAT
jgi:phage tail sheath protein FI